MIEIAPIKFFNVQNKYRDVLKACLHSTNICKSSISSTSCFNLGKVYCKDIDLVKL